MAEYEYQNLSVVPSLDFIRREVSVSAMSNKTIGSMNFIPDHAEHGKCLTILFSTALDSSDETTLGGIVDASLGKLELFRVREDLKTHILPNDYAEELGITCSASGLSIDTEIVNLEIDDETVVTADPDDTKYVRVSLVYDSTDDSFGIRVDERTTGAYAGLDEGEYLVQQDIKEFSVVADGTELVEV